MQHSKKYQQGISLYIVIIIVLLSMLLALWGSRTAIFNEMIVGNDADYQRAYEAAQAMLQDAELDIQNKTSNGISCDSVTDRVCRSNSSTGTVQVVTDLSNLQKFSDGMPKNSGYCLDGLCSKRLGAQDFWNNKDLMSKMTAAGARYGQYTGNKDSTKNPILSKSAENEGAWYWVEIMKHKDEPVVNMIGEDAGSGIRAQLIYRVTAIARGIKPSTQVVLQSSFVLQPPDE